MGTKGLYIPTACLLATVVLTALGYAGVLSSRAYSMLVAASGYAWGLAAALYLYFGAAALEKRLGIFLAGGLIIAAVYFGVVPDISGIMLVTYLSDWPLGQ